MHWPAAFVVKLILHLLRFVAVDFLNRCDLDVSTIAEKIGVIKNKLK